MHALIRRALVVASLTASLVSAGSAAGDGTPHAPAPYGPAHFRERPARQELIYFVLPDRFENADPSNDRGGLHGGPLITGFDPQSAGFFHGGDLRGVRARLDYIAGLGTTAIWLGALFQNQVVQGPPGQESAGYHGYWITDFTRVDPHFGSAADLHALIDAAHERGIKVYLDIVINHTADVIRYRECPTTTCPYRSRADYPYTRRGGIGGEAINDGFAGDAATDQTAENFSHLTRADYAYTPFLPIGKEHVKVPEWLNDPIYYHNRGNSDAPGESALLGDFSGLDDLMTEHPRVVQGFIEIYGRWIDDFGIDGFRIDTAKHVNAEFWQAFVPAMQQRATARGIPHFHIFGEVQSTAFDPALLARHTRVDGLPSVLDFGFAAAVRDVVAGETGTARLAELFADDVLYAGGPAAALELPTFISNHDDGRFAYLVHRQKPDAAPAEVLRRVTLAYAMLYTLRGVPVLYYGDEQGFSGGVDRDGREDMFPSRTPAYLARASLGMPAGAARRSFDTTHPLYRAVAALATMRRTTPALREGRQVPRFASPHPGLFAVSRFDPDTGAEVLIAFNTSSTAIVANVEIDPRSRVFRALDGACAAAPSAPGSYPVHLEALGYQVCAAEPLR